MLELAGANDSATVESEELLEGTTQDIQEAVGAAKESSERVEKSVEKAEEIEEAM